jgi:putative endonuclease
MAHFVAEEAREIQGLAVRIKKIEGAAQRRPPHGSAPPYPSLPCPMSPWLVYLLRCRDGSLYCGITNDLPKRLKAHATGKASRYTRSRLPVALDYTEPQKSKSAALKREAAIKRLTRAEKDRLVVKGTTPRVREGRPRNRAKT